MPSSNKKSQTVKHKLARSGQALDPTMADFLLSVPASLILNPRLSNDAKLLLMELSCRPGDGGDVRRTAACLSHLSLDAAAAVVKEALAERYLRIDEAGDLWVVLDGGRS